MKLSVFTPCYNEIETSDAVLTKVLSVNRNGDGVDVSPNYGVFSNSGDIQRNSAVHDLDKREMPKTGEVSV